jgi:hypothetical protein
MSQSCDLNPFSKFFLRFNPRWDDLRGDKRFDKIIAAAKASSR